MPAIRTATFKLVRGMHVRLLSKPLPRKLAIYFHELERPQWPAFEECASYFQALGYVSAAPSEFAADASERRLLFVSFDDCFSNWHAALRMLAKLDISATFYANSLPFRDAASTTEIAAYLSRINYKGHDKTLSRSELREISQAGHTIGCHSHSHLPLTQVARVSWPAEIDTSKHIIEDIIGAPVTDFSYPYGMRRFFSRDLRDYCVQTGFRTIATAIPGLQTADHVDPLNIYRTRWRLDSPLQENLADLKVDGRVFERLTGRSPVG